MLSVISPAKTLDFETPATTTKSTEPTFVRETQQLVELMQKKSPKDLTRLMGISPKLAELNVERYQNWRDDTSSAKQAILAFKGDVYIGLEADKFGERDLTFAQKNLRILSGLYGLLRPLDVIQPYRLEMGTKLKTRKGKSLYEFWASQINEHLLEEISTHRNKTLINLASQEYFGVLSRNPLPVRVITPVFKDYSRGTYKVLGFFAKKARGAMAAYIVKNRITTPVAIKDFDQDGYTYNETYSNDDQWVFTRKAS